MLEPAGMATELGIVTAVLLETRVTVVAVDAAAESVTVHCVVPEPVRVAGAQPTLAIVVGEVMVSSAVTVTPASEALTVAEVTMAEVAPLEVAAAAVNWPLIAPWGAGTLDGTVIAAARN